MIPLSLAVVVPTMMLSTAHSYERAAAAEYQAAYATMQQNGCPMLVLIGTDWCPACRRMTGEVIPQLRSHGALNRVAFAYVNADRSSELAGKLMRGGSIPQMVIYRKTNDGFRATRLVGAQSAERVELLIDEILHRSEDGSARTASAEMN